ncbi:MAG: twin-arginine translocation signal domain-containing protein [Chitinophagaceae bacterium]|nr:twin-arginine translocation signal domain-containing protein [Chitinophagaceae bacterium]
MNIKRRNFLKSASLLSGSVALGSIIPAGAVWASPLFEQKKES